MVMSVSFPVVPQKTLKTLSGMCKHLFKKKNKNSFKKEKFTNPSFFLFFFHLFNFIFCFSFHFFVGGGLHDTQLWGFRTHLLCNTRNLWTENYKAVEIGRKENEEEERRMINKSKRREDDGSQLCFFLYGPQTFHIEKYMRGERESGRVFLLLFFGVYLINIYVHAR